VAALKQGNEAEQNLCTVISFKLLKRSPGLYNTAEMKDKTNLETRFLVVNMAEPPDADSALMKANASAGLELRNNHHYNYHNSRHYPLSCLLFKTQLNSIGLSVPHRMHITSPLRAQQVNAIYRLVTMVY
jgi:hypothetical protein